MISFNQVDDILVYNGVVDFRKSIDGLAALVEQELGEDPFSKTLFLFFSRNKSKVKILYWDQTGFVLWYKRLEKDKFILPKKLSEKRLMITNQQLQWLLSGYDVWKMKPHEVREYKNVS